MLTSTVLYDLLGHGFNLCYLAAFMVNGRSRMRYLMMLAATLEMIYFLNVAGTPLWSGVLWSTAYLVYAGTMLLKEHFTVNGPFLRTDS